MKPGSTEHSLNVESAAILEPKPRASSTASTRSSEDPFVEIFVEYSPLVLRTLRYLGIPEAEVEDAAQDIFLIIHRKLPGFEGRSTLKTWITGICLRVASKRRRKLRRNRERPFEDLPDIAVSATSLRAVELEQSRAMLRRALEELDEPKRAVFVMHEIAEMPIHEIAEAVGCPQPTAYYRLYAARRQLYAAIRRMQRRKVGP